MNESMTSSASLAPLFICHQWQPNRPSINSLRSATISLSNLQQNVANVNANISEIFKFTQNTNYVNNDLNIRISNSKHCTAQ